VRATDAPAKSGDAAWFEAVYHAHAPDLRRFVARRVTADAVDDALSEIFLIAWRRRQDYRPEEARLWLFAVARGVIANLLRADRRRALLQDRAESEAVAQSVVHPAEPWQVSQVRQALSALSDLEQEVLRLVAWDCLTTTEAAAVSGCSQAAFRVRLFRARRHLAARLASSDAADRSSSLDREGLR